MQESVIRTFFYLTNLNIEIESILEVWMMNWMFYEYDSFFTDIDCESWVWFGIGEHDSYSMNVDCDTKVWFMIWDGLYLMNINHLRIE